MTQETITLADYQALTKPKNKYGAKKVEIDGQWFDSQLEGRRYRELKILERCGHIRNLKIHPSFPLVVNETLIAHWEADFTYFSMQKGEPVIEDTKSPATRKEKSYRLKRKLFEAIYGRTVTEVF